MMKTLNKSEIKRINEELNQLYNIEPFFHKKDRILDDNNRILKDNKILFFRYENKLIPTLKVLLENNFMKKITVDMGAVKFVTSGADIMRPGITDIDDNIKKGESVAIIDQTHKKPLAVGIALLSSEELRNADKGKVIKNIHYVGDEIWS